jgi:DNA-binding NarL/FixJ family response regulator
MPVVVFLTSDLMFSGQVLGAAAALGLKLNLIANPAELAAKLPAACRLVLIDLTLPGLKLDSVVTTAKATAPSARVVAFGPHVDEQSLAAAQAAGADVVLTRGQFHRQYTELLRMAGAT